MADRELHGVRGRVPPTSRAGSPSGAARLGRRVRNRSANLRRIVRYYANVAAVDTRLRRGGREYTRFIILSQGRSGTNFLRGLLNSHRGIIVHGELFRDFDSVPGGMAKLLQSKRALRHKRADPLGFIDGTVFRRMPQHIGAVGFKIFYNHAHDPAWQPIWSHLQNDENLRVIHMRRRNALAMYLSLVRASRGGWVNSRLDGSAVHLDYDDCLAAFEQARRWQHEYESFVPPHRMLDVEYEALAADRDAVTARVLDFIGVEPQPLSPGTIKQSAQPLSQAIANYVELKERFAGTMWSSYFGD